jgi:hypothetical protein
MLLLLAPIRYRVFVLSHSQTRGGSMLLLAIVVLIYYLGPGQFLRCLLRLIISFIPAIRSRCTSSNASFPQQRLHHRASCRGQCGQCVCFCLHLCVVSTLPPNYFKVWSFPPSWLALGLNPDALTPNCSLTTFISTKIIHC